ncbi:hypothetical protein FRC08_007939 [Ceratobasidium sp. 394]|nr:hypothetical protein FRC08_007939 [Ceratobasidium sp. 394]
MPSFARDYNEPEQALPVARAGTSGRMSVLAQAPRRPLATSPEPGREQSAERGNQTTVRSKGAGTR